MFCRFDLFCYPICISFIHRFKVMIICIIVCLSWAVNHYRDNAITRLAP
ncbi:hypothetical protein GJD92_17020 [Escherichia coli]|nr:hypothetical protein GJD92_17020 [Escherichia coli]